MANFISSTDWQPAPWWVSRQIDGGVRVTASSTAGLEEAKRAFSPHIVWEIPLDGAHVLIGHLPPREPQRDVPDDEKPAADAELPYRAWTGGHTWTVSAATPTDQPGGLTVNWKPPFPGVKAGDTLSFEAKVEQEPQSVGCSDGCNGDCYECDEPLPRWKVGVSDYKGMRFFPVTGNLRLDGDRLTFEDDDGECVALFPAGHWTHAWKVED